MIQIDYLVYVLRFRVPMFKKIVKLFAAPPFDDPEEARIAEFLYPISVSTIVITLVVLLVWQTWLPNPLILRASIMGILFTLLAVTCIICIRTSKVKLSSQIAAIGSWGVVFISALLFGGVNNTAYTSLIPLAILISGVLVGRRYSIVLSALSLACGLIMVWASQRGYLPGMIVEVDKPIYFLLGTVPALVLIPIIVQIFHDNFAQLAERTRQNEIERNHAKITTERATQLENEVARQKAMEKMLITARQRAEEGEQVKGQFLANMSHEIRTPLNAIIGMTSLILDKELDQGVRTDVETIRRSSELLLDILNEVLDYSKVESGQIEFEELPILLTEAIEAVIVLVTPASQLKQLSIDYSIDDETPPTVLTDITRLQQILLNLMSNAVKFTDVGHIQLHVSSRHIDEDEYLLHFAVSDTGIGIPEEKIHRLFQPFSQVDASTTRRFGGTGLGLMISHRLSESMGGRMWAESVEHQGSTFHFTIKAKAGDTSPEIFDEQRENYKIEYLSEHPLNILLVEDNVVNQKVAQRILQRLGYYPDLAKNGLDAVHSVQRQQYDLIFMDIHMPEMDGLEAAANIKRLLPKESHPRIVAMTASTIPEDKETAIQVGMDAFLIKPVRVAEIRAILLSTRPLGTPKKPSEKSVVPL
ncbi:MAG: ATP-binding protein [Chloroflexota bacterium]